MDEHSVPNDDGWIEAPVIKKKRRSISLPKLPQGIRWQFVALILGIALIVSSGVVLITGAGGIPLATGERPPTFSFPDTDIFSEASVGEPEFVNPLLAQSQADTDLASLVFSGLTRVDEFGQPVPDLAENWEVSGDGLVYVFKLREDVTWHDGTPLTANDVAFTMSLLRDPDFPGDAALNEFWRTVETYADDDYTVRFVLTQPLTAFPEYAGIGILPERWLRGITAEDLEEDQFNLDPIGTGPLNWLSVGRGGGATVVRLEPYTDYYDTSRQIQLREIHLLYYGNANQAFRAVGPDAQALSTITPDQKNVMLQSPEINVYSSRLPAYGVVVFNQRNSDVAFFQEEVVRDAFSLSLNRQATVQQIFTGGEALVAYTPILPGSWAYNPDLLVFPTDPLGASQDLSMLGFANQNGVRARGDERLEFELLVSNQNVELANLIARQWAEIGASVQVRSVNPQQLAERVHPEDGEPDFEAALIEISQGGYADPDPYPFWHESQIENGQNYSGVADRDISEILEIARKEPNGVRRAELYRDFQRWFYEHSVAVVLYNPIYDYVVSCQIQGVQVKVLRGPEDRFRNLHEWRIASPDEIDDVCG